MTTVDFVEIPKGRPHLKVTWEETTWWRKCWNYKRANRWWWDRKIWRRTERMLIYRIPVRKRGGVRGRLLSLKKRVKAYLFSSLLFLDTWETGDAIFLNLRLTFLRVITDMRWSFYLSSVTAVDGVVQMLCGTVWESGTCDKWSEMHSVVARSIIRGVIQWSDAQINVIWLSEGWEGGTRAWVGGRERDRWINGKKRQIDLKFESEVDSM